MYKKFLMLMVLVFGFTSVALGSGHGHVIFTPTLVKANNEMFTCRAVNTGDRAHQIDLVILSSTGTLLETQKSTLLKPGYTTSDSTKTTKNTIAYCKVTSQDSDEDILVTLCSQTTTNPSCLAVVTGQ